MHVCACVCARVCMCAFFLDQERATSPVGCVVQHVYAGECLKSVRIVRSLVRLVTSPTGSHEEKLEEALVAVLQ